MERKLACPEYKKQHGPHEKREAITKQRKCGIAPDERSDPPRSESWARRFGLGTPEARLLDEGKKELNILRHLTASH